MQAFPRDLWAKSPVPGRNQGETIAAHTRKVLLVLAALYRLRPDLARMIGSPRFWHHAFWACFLHDFGKAARGFQSQLREGKRWGQRHEVLSLAFVHWLLDRDDPDYRWIVAAIAAHHKDAKDIKSSYPDELDIEDDAIPAMVDEVEDEALEALWLFLHDHADAWRQELGFANAGVEALLLKDKAEAMAAFRREACERIHQALRQYQATVRKLEKRRLDPAETRAAIALRGTVINADHLGSANLFHSPQFPLQGVSSTLQALSLSWNVLYDHQRKAAQHQGSVILRAPTGSGKTEAAILWAAGQVDAGVRPPRLFYVLPFQASMNAMYDRLYASFGDCIGLQHGHSLHALYRRLLDQEMSPSEAERAAKRAKNLARLHHLPLRVLSPYQLLKACYRLRGYEALLADLYNGVFILDEIHAYEPKRLAMIVKMIEHLTRYYGARFFIMSATLPSLIQQELATAIGVDLDIVADANVFAAFRRHVAQVLDGDLLDECAIERIVADARAGKSVLVCCNTVARAQQAYDTLRGQLHEAGASVDLLHSRFNPRDRNQKEQAVIDRVGIDQQSQRPTVLVATQVVEVSLNIDFDLIYTDPAPLEALLQRFGRVNRRGRKGLCPVYVFRLPDDGQGIYDSRLVGRAIAILDRSGGNGLPIDEAQVRDWLDEIYQNDIAASWKRDFDRSASAFEDVCLGSLYPFQSDEALEDTFYEAFDAVDVLPACLEQEYKSIAEDQLLEAGSLLVSIRFNALGMLRAKGKVVQGSGRWPIVVDVPYDSERGLRIHDNRE